MQEGHTLDMSQACIPLGTGGAAQLAVLVAMVPRVLLALGYAIHGCGGAIGL